MMENNSTVAKLELNFEEHLIRLPILIVVVTIGISVSAFNIITISIIFRSKKLRRPFNYPILNILLAATLQSFFTIPAYALNRLDQSFPHNQESWICNIYKFPFILCGGILRLSFMLVSMDRLCAIKYAYFYKDCTVKKVYIFVIIMMWIVVSVIDAIPFLPVDKPVDNKFCTYNPGHVWGITETIAFNITPFIITIIIFFILWRIASKITVKAHSMQKELSKREEEEKIYKEKEIFEMEQSVKRKKVMEVEVSRKLYEENRKTVVNRKISYMYAVREPKDYHHNFPEVEIDIEEPDCSALQVDSEFTSCIPVRHISEKLRLILEMRATKTSALLLLVYMICWTPLGIFQFIENVCSGCRSEIRNENGQIIQFALKVMSLLSSIFLPVVYCWKTKLFRKEARLLSTRIRARVMEIPFGYKGKFQRSPATSDRR